MQLYVKLNTCDWVESWNIYETTPLKCRQNNCQPPSARHRVTFNPSLHSRIHQPRRPMVSLPLCNAWCCCRPVPPRCGCRSVCENSYYRFISRECRCRNASRRVTSVSVPSWRSANRSVSCLLYSLFEGLMRLDMFPSSETPSWQVLL